MSKFCCTCGNIIHISGEIPNPNEWLLISDNEYNNFNGAIDSEELYMKMRSLLMCSKCKALWIFWEGYDKDPALYLPSMA
jgi:hypothetical protein